MNKNDFYEEIKKLSIILTDNQKLQIDNYITLLIDYNKHTNLTAIKSLNDIYLKHFYDSLTLIKVTKFTDNMSILDVGSGAGFPGMVLAIVFSNANVTLIDSNHKKTDFLIYLKEKLKIKNVIIINDRVENFYKKQIKFDLVVARAVANLNILLELCLPFAKQDGYFIAMKGQIDEELSISNQAIEYLGGEIADLQIFLLPFSESDRSLLKIKKIKNTPIGYPRSYQNILKKPL